ncbi:MAG: TonB-dependent receptor [Bacteroidales bacterium]|nr:TonB-dependent receptor [Bacteroidales bacterium]
MSQKLTCYIAAIILSFSLSVFHLSTTAQQHPGGYDDFVPAAEVIKALQEKHNISIFYKDEWLTDDYVSTYLLEQAVEDVIQFIARVSSLTPVVVDNMYFLLPRDRMQADQLSSRNDVLVIGNPSEYGRYSRAVITGRVLDAATFQPLFGAVIYEAQTETGATTSFDGSFSMELPVGEYNLRISYVGYEEGNQRVRLISSGEINLELFEGTTHLKEVVITARRAEDNIRRTQMSMISIDAQTLQELPGTFGEQDIVRSFTLMPGIQTIGEFGSGFNVRGGSADQNLILVENVPLFNSSHLFGLISVINPDMVSNVTLMKAGIPARFGERASSVMDIRLGNGTEIEQAGFEGGIGLINSRFLFETPIVKDKASFMFGARSSYSDYLLQNIPNEDLMNSSVGFYDLSGLLNIALTPNNRITLFGYRSFDRSNFGDDVDYEYFNHLASFRLNSMFSSRTASTFIAGYSNYQYMLAEMPADNPEGQYRINSDVEYKSLKWYLSFFPDENHSLEAGINVIHYQIEPGTLSALQEVSNITDRIIDREQGLEAAAFLSWEMLFSDRAAMELGLRYTHYYLLGPANVRHYLPDRPLSPNTITDTTFYASNKVVTDYGGLEPRFGFRYSLGENNSMKISYNRANQYIHLISNTSVMAPADLWKLSDTYLKPLKSDQYAIGYFHNFFDNTLETSLEVYFKQIHNDIEYRSGAQIAMNEMIEMDVLNVKGYNYGAELYVRKNTGDLTGFLSYTYSTAQRRTQSPHPELQINNNNYFPSNYDRPHNLTLNANYHLSRRWRLGATFTYNTGRPITLPELTYRFGNDLLLHYSDRNSHRLPDYHRLDISVSLGENLRIRQRGKGSWTFSILNVYGRKNPFSVFYKKEPRTAQSHRSFDLYQLYIIGRPLPTLTYNFSF